MNEQNPTPVGQEVSRGCWVSFDRAPPVARQRFGRSVVPHGVVRAPSGRKSAGGGMPTAVQSSTAAPFDELSGPGGLRRRLLGRTPDRRRNVANSLVRGVHNPGTGQWKMYFE